jgi:hypothetical protein
MGVREIELQIVNWIHAAQDRVQWRAVVHSNEPLGSIKGGGELIIG